MCVKNVPDMHINVKGSGVFEMLHKTGNVSCADKV